MTVVLKECLSLFLTLGLVVGVAVLSLFTLGESPTLLFEVLRATLGTSFGLGYTLFYMTPLVFTGLSAAIGFQAGLFNIGAEGQLYVASLVIVAFAYFFPGLPQPFSTLLGIIMSAIAGALWAGIAGLLKAKRGSHEVLVTILLNFIAVACVDYAILYLLKDPLSQNPETITIGSPYFLPTLHGLLHASLGVNWLASTPANASLIVAIALAVFLHFFMVHTVWGFEIRAFGENKVAGQMAGISPNRCILWVFGISGACAGLVGINEVMGHAHRLMEGFSPGYGFTGIAVALVAKNRPIHILFSAFLFGILHNGARELEFLSDRVSKEVSIVIQAVIVALVATEPWVRKKLSRWIERNHG